VWFGARMFNSKLSGILPVPLHSRKHLGDIRRMASYPFLKAAFLHLASRAAICLRVMPLYCGPIWSTFEIRISSPTNGLEIFTF